ncbi:MAG: xylulokinase [Candidatus Brockarchaeota archaeon]|nr:xylulokinase [Candidatus Brockarchaeota archaeon]
MASYVLSHDLGTTGDKAVLFDLDKGSIAASAFEGYRTFHPRPTWAEQDPRDWSGSFAKATRKLLKVCKARPEEVRALSFSGQMLGCLGVSKTGKPLMRSVIWMDQRSVKQANAIREKIGERSYYETTGNRISPTYTISKILWLKSERPSKYREAHKFLQAKDYVISRLTGNFCTDYSDASLSGMFDITKRRWAYPILDELGIDEGKLPEARASTEIVGELSGEAAHEVGLRRGTPVVLGGGDGPCAAVGAGVVRPGSAYVYIGASSWIAVCAERPLLDPKMRIFNQWHLDPGMVSPTGTMQAAGSSYRWLRDEVCSIERERAAKAGKDPYSIMDSEARKVEPGSGNVIFLPYLMGERSPWWNPNARGVFFGLALGHQRRNVIRSVLEGVGFNLKTILDALQESGEKVERMVAIGGGARSKFWRQVLADILGKKIAAIRNPEEATSVGAAVAGAIGIGFYKDFLAAEKLVRVASEELPDAENHRKYVAYHGFFERLYFVLVPFFDELAAMGAGG